MAPEYMNLMPKHPKMHFFDPTMILLELTYTIAIVLLCFLVFYKTKEMYNLTKHKGIEYFRYTFLFFGLAYASRFIFGLLQLSNMTFDLFIPRNMLGPVFIIPVGYFSTMALFFLVYSTVWKKIKYEHFFMAASIIAVLASAAAYVTRSPMLLSLIQLPLIIAALVLSARKKKKKKTHTKQIYFLIAIFWLTNLLVLSPRIIMPFGLSLFIQAVSIAVFIFIFYKVLKWTR